MNSKFESFELNDFFFKVFKFVKDGVVSKEGVVQPQIAREGKGVVVTKDIMKEYSVVYDKRWVLDDFSTLPFGTCEE